MAPTGHWLRISRRLVSGAGVAGLGLLAQYGS